MSERTLQFRVGLFVIITSALAVTLILRLGEMQWLWNESYTVSVHFSEAPGVQVGTPVRKNGIQIGAVREVFFDEQQGGVMVVLDVQERHVLRKDSQARLMSSLLGDPSIEFSPGKSRELLKPGTQLTGEVPANAVEIVRQFESKMTVTMESFAATSREWSLVGRNLNSLMSTHRGNLDLVVERAAESLHQFTQTMQNANQLFGDPENQRNIRETLASLAAMSHETRTTIASARTAVESAQHNLDNLKGVTSALARHSESIAGKLDHSAGNLELLLAELNQFARHLSDEEGSLKLLATDPSLYRNLNRSASSLDILLRNLQPITEDLRILSDKLARHPELLGVRGALQGSTGLKTTDEAAPHTPGRISIGPVKNPR